MLECNKLNHENEYYPICTGKTDCAACKNGYCIALTDTDFHGRFCSFYKSKEQNDAECLACRQRLMKIAISA